MRSPTLAFRQSLHRVCRSCNTGAYPLINLLQNSFPFVSTFSVNTGLPWRKYPLRVLAPASIAVGDWASVARDHWSHPILRKLVSDSKLTQLQSVTSPWLPHPPDRCQELPSSGTNTADELFPGLQWSWYLIGILPSNFCGSYRTHQGPVPRSPISLIVDKVETCLPVCFWIWGGISAKTPVVQVESL